MIAYVGLVNKPSFWSSVVKQCKEKLALPPKHRPRRKTAIKSPTIEATNTNLCRFESVENEGCCGTLDSNVAVASCKVSCSNFSRDFRDASYSTFKLSHSTPWQRCIRCKKIWSTSSSWASRAEAAANRAMAFPWVSLNLGIPRKTLE